MKAESLRLAYGQALVELGRKMIAVVLEADLGKSTMSILFQEAFPSRYFEMGICRSEHGWHRCRARWWARYHLSIPSAVFAAGRAYDQIRQSIAIAGSTSRSAALVPGFRTSATVTHQSIEDMATCGPFPI